MSIGTAGLAAGPSLPGSFFVAAIGCAMTGLCYAEMACRIPRSGTAYSYVYHTLGELPAFVVGLMLCMGMIVSIAAVARGWTNYFLLFLQIVGIQNEGGMDSHGSLLPAWFFHQPIDNTAWSISVLSLVLVILSGMFVVRGIDGNTTCNNVFTVVNVLMLACFIGIGFTKFDGSLFTSQEIPEGIIGTIKGSGLLFFSYLGFDTAACLTEEAADPARSLPRAILSSISITCALYMVVAVCFVGLAPLSEIDPYAPLGSAFEIRGLNFVSSMLCVGALTNTLTTVFTTQVAAPRLIFRMAADG